MCVNEIMMYPPHLNDFEFYEDFKDMVMLWDSITDVPKEKRGALLVLGLPNRSVIHGNNIVSSIMDSLRPAKENLKNEDGLKMVLELLDKRLGACPFFDGTGGLVSYKRQPGQDVLDYVSEFEARLFRYNQVHEELMNEQMLALLLLAGANIEEEHNQIYKILAKEIEKGNYYPTVFKKLKFFFTPLPHKLSE